MSFDIKWMMTLTLIVFGGLFGYQHFSRIEMDVSKAEVAASIGQLAVRAGKDGFRESSVRNAESYLIFLARST